MTQAMRCLCDGKISLGNAQPLCLFGVKIAG